MIRNSAELLSVAWPLTRLPRVFHVGSLDPKDKGRQGHSLEGAGLSVSLHPAEWTHIARLGGHPTWKLRKKGGGTFLAFNLLSAHQKGLLAGWAVAAGYLQDQVVWEVSWYDSEVDDTVFSWFDAEATAQAEFEELREHDESAAVRSVTTGRATSKMRVRCGFDPGGLNDMSIAATFFAEDVLGLDGVWWEDTLDPSALSAPRGGINLTSLPNWSSSRAI